MASRLPFRGPTSNLYKTEVGWPWTGSSFTSSRLTIVEDTLAAPGWIDGHFPKTRNAAENLMLLFIAREDGLVVARRRGKVRLCLVQLGQISMQPGWVNRSLLGPETGQHRRQQEYESPGHLECVVEGRACA